MSSKTVYRPCHSLRRAGGPWGVINTLRTASLGTRRHQVRQETALNVASASRASRRVLAGRGKQSLGKDASAARPRKRVRCVTKGTRDPSSPAGGGTFKLSGLPRSGSLIYPLIVARPNLRLCERETRKDHASERTTVVVSMSIVLNVLTSLPF